MRVEEQLGDMQKQFSEKLKAPSVSADDFAAFGKLLSETFNAYLAKVQESIAKTIMPIIDELRMEVVAARSDRSCDILRRDIEVLRRELQDMFERYELRASGAPADDLLLDRIEEM